MKYSFMSILVKKGNDVNVECHETSLLVSLQSCYYVIVYVAESMEGMWSSLASG